ncbi:DUF2796 domain-containing protein [Shimia thalassica]|uniref:zinc uptake protein ZrgA n=1 Tax=Shimia thalassica TaxID=1715693 RepID=UPI001C09B31F|nr:DUF2796 domain-containing protein [Shimia thalassica]MBU2942788.1 DUF2796 domain-containing protein [Shimia thalassica]MDO6502444.1 DUF2796 domain-containing protein [Shimia thalassica]
MKQNLPILLSLLALPAFAEGTRELDSHEHGVGELNIAMEGKTIAMELHAPGADIVGFEYAATSDEDRAAIENAVATLAKPLDLFSFPDAAKCTVTRASAELEAEEDHDDHAKHDDHDDHDDHAEHDDHAKHDDHDDHAEEASHTEFHAEYVLNCDNPDAISKINFAYFEAFPNALELEVQIVSSAGAKAFEVERDAPTLDLRGMF